MSVITVKRSDISLSEEFDSEPSLMLAPTRYWTASLFGYRSTGEHVDMSRNGNSPEDALANLEEAIDDLGWVIE